jgi:hypothetical protein
VVDLLGRKGHEAGLCCKTGPEGIIDERTGQEVVRSVDHSILQMDCSYNCIMYKH